MVNLTSTHTLPPAGLSRRPVNAALAASCAQTGRKEAAGEEKVFVRGSADAFPRCAAPNPGKGLRPLHSLGDMSGCQSKWLENKIWHTLGDE
jgi:hypothetical protein